MKTVKKILLLFLLCIAAGASAQERRPIDSRHPLWMIHIDVWNNANPQRIIDLIPKDVRPFVCFNLSMSCAYDTDLDIYKKPQSAVLTYKSWGSVCCANNVWFTCQPASGGHTHIQDDDLETFEYFFKRYKNFLGWNYAEQFWGFDEAGDESSSSQTDRLALFAKLVPMHHKYGGFLTISFCGNIWSHGLNPVGMMKRNNALLKACQEYPEACLWLYKYTTSSCWYNNESVTIAPFISGLAKNYGVRYDNCGWNGAMDALLGENHGHTYPNSTGYGPVLDQTCINGGAVWDGPELIWTEDFKEIGTSTVNGYTRRNWTTYNSFSRGWLDVFRKILDGTIYIPTREEVLGRTKIAIINDINSGNDEQKYAATGDLYDGLYKQNDPMNRGNGQWMDNFCYFKSTGRYQAIPVMINCYDELSKAIPLRVKKSSLSTRWTTQAKKVAEFKKYYPEVSQGDLFVARHNNQLVTYYPFSYLTARKTASAVIPLEYNTCESLELQYHSFGNGIVNEYEDHIDFYLNNYRMDSTSVVIDRITVHGATQQPTYTYAKRASANVSTPVETWDEETGTYTLDVKHMGAVELTINCSGSSEKSGNYTVVNDRTPLVAPDVPEDYYGELIHEAEDMDYKNIADCVTNQYDYGWGKFRSVRGHSGMGFVNLGTNTAGSLRDSIYLKQGGDYVITLRYHSTKKNGRLTAKLNGKTVQFNCPKGAVNEWQDASIEGTLKNGGNCLIINNASGVDMYIDKVTYAPADLPAEIFSITLEQTKGGTISASASEAPKGTEITLTAVPDEGYRFDGWTVVRGGTVKIEDGRFTMPERDITLRGVFSDASKIYKLDFSSTLSGTLPAGWRAVQGGDEVHSYPNTYTSGGRTFAGFTGYQGKALYWREVNADFGRMDGFKLHLAPCKYRFTFANAAWKESPSYSAQILDAKGKVILQSPTYKATPNANGNTSANISSAKTYTLDLEIKEEGDYIINFVNESGGFSEFLLCECTISIDPAYVGIDEATQSSDATEPASVYGLDGTRRHTLNRGVNIIMMKDGTARKVIVR